MSWYHTAKGSPERYNVFWRNHPDIKVLPYKYRMALLTSRRGMVLDAGCGTGILIDYLSPNTVFTDFSSEAVKHPALHGRPRVIASVEDLPFKDQVFEHVLAINLIEHLDSPPRFFAEASRVLKPNGQMIFSYPSSSRTNAHKFRKISMKTLNSWCVPHFSYKFFERYGLKRLVVVAYKHEDL